MKRLPATIEDLAARLGLLERERTPTLWVGAGGRRVRIAIDFVARPDAGGSAATDGPASTGSDEERR